MSGVQARVVALFRAGAAEASSALTRWLGRSATVTVEEVRRLPLEAAGGILGGADEPICACAMGISGGMEGVLVLVSDDASGLALCDTLLEREAGTSQAWGDVERSAFAETANIVGCAYLNVIARAVDESTDGVVPTPPWFVRDYAPALMDAILVEQAAVAADVFLTRTEFRIASAPVRCGLVFVPHAASLRAIETLGRRSS